MDFDSNQYAFADIEVVMFGRPIIGLRGIRYKVSQDVEPIYGRGNKPIAMSKGNKSYEGEIMLLQSELEALTRAAGNDKDIYDLPLFDIVVAYIPEETLPIVTDTIKRVKLTEVEKAMNQGDKFMEITIPFVALDIKKGV